MTFEGTQLQGSVKIAEKLSVSARIVVFDYLQKITFFSHLQGLSFQKINRAITAVDSQPMFDGGVMINVIGRLQVCLKICLHRLIFYSFRTLRKNALFYFLIHKRMFVSRCSCTKRFHTLFYV